MSNCTPQIQTQSIFIEHSAWIYIENQEYETRMGWFNSIIIMTHHILILTLSIWLSLVCQNAGLSAFPISICIVMRSSKPLRIAVLVWDRFDMMYCDVSPFMWSLWSSGLSLPSWLWAFLFFHAYHNCVLLTRCHHISRIYGRSGQRQYIGHLLQVPKSKIVFNNIWIYLHLTWIIYHRFSLTLPRFVAFWFVIIVDVVFLFVPSNF